MFLRNLSVLNFETFQNSGSQFGHRISEWRPSILGSNNFISKRNEFLIFNLKNSLVFLQKAYLFFKQMSYRGSIALYIDGGKLNSLIIKAAASFVNVSYISNLWAGGTLTNFREVIYKVSRKSKNLRRLKNKTLRYISGVYQLDFIPEVIISSSEFYSPFAITESNTLLIPSIAVSDSNIISLESTYPVLLNDDSFLTIKSIFFVLSSSYWFGKADFAMRYLGATGLILRKLLLFSSIILNKHSLRGWLRSIRKRSSSSLILKILSVVGLEPTFSFTRSGF